jgi:hypothetical protein
MRNISGYCGHDRSYWACAVSCVRSSPDSPQHSDSVVFSNTSLVLILFLFCACAKSSSSTNTGYNESYLWRMLSSGLLRRVAHVRTDVTEERSASIIRVTRIGKLGTTLAVTSNRCTLWRNIMWYWTQILRHSAMLCLCTYHTHEMKPYGRGY